MIPTLQLGGVGRRYKQGGFDPASFFAAGEQGLIYDLFDFSTLWQDTAGTVAVTATGQTVKRVNDKSGRGHHMTNATGWVLGVTNGMYHLTPNGTSSFATINTIDLSATDKVTVWVGTYTASSGNQGIWSTAGGVGQTTGLLTGFNVRTQLVGSSATAEIFNSGGVSGSYVWTFVCDLAGAAFQDELKMYRNNVLQSTTGGGPAGGGSLQNSAWTIGDYVDAGLFLNGRLYSMIVRGGASTAQNYADGANWVNGKTGAY